MGGKIAIAVWVLIGLGMFGCLVWSRQEENKRVLWVAQERLLNLSRPYSDIQFGVDDQDEVVDARYCIWVSIQREPVVCMDYPTGQIGKRLEGNW